MNKQTHYLLPDEYNKPKRVNLWIEWGSLLLSVLACALFFMMILRCATAGVWQ